MAIDLNADMGEGAGDDAALLSIVTSASIACGGHAGDEASIRAALKGAKENGVRAGAHPGFADRENFGRVRLDMPVAGIIDQVITQMTYFHDLAAQEDVTPAYIKLHGALANMAAEDQELAHEIFASVSSTFGPLAVMALEHSGQQRAVEALGLEVIHEAYADRAYLPNGQLAPRTMAGSVLHDNAEVVQRCLRLAQSGEIVAIDGSVFRSSAASICVHSDTPGAVEMAWAVRGALENAGLMVSR